MNIKQIEVILTIVLYIDTITSIWVITKNLIDLLKTLL